MNILLTMNVTVPALESLDWILNKVAVTSILSHPI